MVEPDILYAALCQIGRIISPQKNIYSKEDIYGKPISFAFRFDIKDGDSVYKRLSNSISEYDGRLKWIMHHEGSKINYTIEPYEFYTTRKSGEEVGKSIIEIMDNKRFAELVDVSLSDINGLCAQIDKEFGRESK